MPVLQCSCGVSLNVDILAQGESLKCPRCGSSMTPSGSAQGNNAPELSFRPQCLAQFGRQYENLATNSSLITFAKGRETLINMKAEFFSPLEHRGELYPCIDATHQAFKGFTVVTAPESLFVGFCSRTGRGAWRASIAKLNEKRKEWANHPDLQRKRIVPDSSLICSAPGCLMNLDRQPKLQSCPRCRGNVGVLIFRLRPRSLGTIGPRPDGSFWGIDIEQDGIVFRVDSNPRRVHYSEASLINIEFWVNTGPFRGNSCGKLHIMIFDADARCFYECYSREKFRYPEFCQFIATIASRTPSTLIYDSGWSDVWTIA